MPSPQLVTKLKIKPDTSMAVIGAAEGYIEELAPLPEGVSVSTQLEGEYDWLQVFVNNSRELSEQFPKVKAAMKPESMLWLTFPKGSSKIQTDLTRDKGWEAVTDLKWINLVSVNETWSAFSLRPYKPGEVRQSFR